MKGISLLFQPLLIRNWDCGIDNLKGLILPNFTITLTTNLDFELLVLNVGEGSLIPDSPIASYDASGDQVARNPVPDPRLTIAFREGAD